MSRGSGHRLIPSLVATLAVGAGATLLLAGCPQDVGDAGCQLTRQLVLPESPLALMQEVRLDRIGAGSLLIGSDGSDVRWLTIESNGVVGTEQAFPLPAGITLAVFAAAGLPDQRPSHILIGYVINAPPDSELHFVAVPIDGSTAALPGPAAVTFAGGATGVPRLAFGSSRTGGNAGLAWVDPESGRVRITAVDATGTLVAPGEVVDSTAASAADCLSFQAGDDDLTLLYLRYPIGTTRSPSWLKAEISRDGIVTRSYSAEVSRMGATVSCHLIGAPIPSGYAVAWQDELGTSLTVTGGTVHNYQLASATDFGGTELQPPTVGLTSFGQDFNSLDFGVLFSRARSVELWRFDAMGRRRPGALVFPSLNGNFGATSAVPSGGVLSATYADYTQAEGEPLAGRRLVVDALCQ